MSADHMARPGGSGSRPSDQAAARPDPSGFDPSRTEPDPVDEVRPFRDVLTEAYDWALDDDGFLWGLTAGDMGYDKTDTKLVDLFTSAQAAEWDRFHRTGEKVWPVHTAVLNFIAALGEATTASGIEAATADETRSGSAEGKSPLGSAETPEAPPGSVETQTEGGRT